LPAERIPPAEGRLEHDPAESTLSVVRRSVEPPSQARNRVGLRHDL